MGSVRSKKYKDIWKSEIRNHPELFKVKIISIHDKREDALLKEEKLRLRFYRDWETDRKSVV